MNNGQLLDSEFSVRTIEVLGHFLWQALAVGIIAELIAVFLRRASSNTRYLLYLAAFLGVAIAPVATWLWLASPPPPIALAPTLGPVAAMSQPTGIVATGLVAIEEFEAPWWRRYAPQLAALYLLGVFAFFTRLVLALGGGWKLRRSSRPIEEAAILGALAAQARRLGLATIPLIAYCDRVVGPTVVGVLRPAILLPLAFTSGLSPDQVELILAHELAHIRRGDHLVNLLQRILEALFFFHPAVWWLSHRIRTEREQCCDDLVVARSGESLVYARALVEAAALQAAHRPGSLAASPATLHLLESKRVSPLKRRVTRLLGATSHERINAPRACVVVLVAVALAVIQGIASEKTGNPLQRSEEVGEAKNKTVRVYSLKHIDSVETADAINALSETDRLGEAKCMAQPDTSLLIIVAGTQEIDLLDDLVEHLDVPENSDLRKRAERFFTQITEEWEAKAQGPQVEIEVRLAEYENSPAEREKIQGVIRSHLGISPEAGPNPTGTMERPEANSLLTAISEITDLRIVSVPKVTVVSGTEGEIVSATTIPVILADGKIAGSTKIVDVDLGIHVTLIPTVIEPDYVDLSLNLEHVSSNGMAKTVDESGNLVSVPIINTQSISSRFRLKVGETLVLAPVWNGVPTSDGRIRETIALLTTRIVKPEKEGAQGSED